MEVDLLIKNGHVIDPLRGIDKVENIAVKSRKIISYTDGMKGKQEIDASGCIVTPGLIDFHAHIYERGTDSGINPDLAMIPQGVTAVVDGGSSGVSNYRLLFELLDRSYVKTKIYLQVSPGGQTTHQFPERYYPAAWNMDKFKIAFETRGSSILGLKIRISKPILTEVGIGVFYEALKLAEQLNTTICVHITNPEAPLSEIAEALRPGDIFCHVFHGTGYTIFNDKGEIFPEILRARERGVLFDMCHGTVNFSFEIAERALKQGFRPDIISTDLNSVSWNHSPAFGLPHIMSKFLYLNMPLPEIIRRVTVIPAKTMGMADRIGSLTEGFDADITILRIEKKRVVFSDALKAEHIGDQYFTPLATIINGSVMFRRPELW
jgi:dihydroorotase